MILLTILSSPLVFALDIFLPEILDSSSNSDARRGVIEVGVIIWITLGYPCGQ